MVPLPCLFHGRVVFGLLVPGLERAEGLPRVDGRLGGVVDEALGGEGEEEGVNVTVCVCGTMRVTTFEM